MIFTKVNSGPHVETHFLEHASDAGTEMPKSNPDQMQKLFKSDISVLIGVLEKNLSISISLRTLTSTQPPFQMLLAENQILKNISWTADPLEDKTTWKVEQICKICSMLAIFIIWIIQKLF